MTRLKSYFDAGLTPGLPPALAKRLAIANRLALVIAAITLPFAPLFALAGHPVLGLLVLPVALGYAVAPILNGRRHYLASRVCMLVTGNVAPFTFALVVGRSSGIQLYLLAVMCLPLVIFAPNERRLIGFFTALPALLFVLLSATDFFGLDPHLGFDESALYWIRLAISAATMGSIVAALGFLFVNNVRAEAGLAATVAEIRREKDLFKTIFYSVADIVFLTDREHRYLAINGNVARYGTTPEQLIGRRLTDLVPAQEAKGFLDHHNEVLRTGEPRTFENAIPSLNGALSTFRITLTAVRDIDGAITGLVGVSRDITDERRVQDVLREARDAADAASNSKTYFLANVSHELRTPLAVISGYAEMLRGLELPDDKARRAVDTVLRNTKHLNALVDDILDVSLIETGRLRIHRVPAALVAELETPLSAMRAAALDKGLSFTVSYDEDLPAVVHLDPVRLRQILLNVVGNAVKFTEKGGITVFVHSGADGLRRLIEITVEDTGCGIPASKAGALFQPFTQADASTSRQYGGIGLGLALSRSLARALGGDVVLLKSDVDKGSVFRIAVESGSIVGETESSLVEEGQVRRTPGLDGARILVVDDTADIRAMLEETLTLHGAQVDSAGDGLSGLALAERHTYDVILMDIQLPGLDGYEVTRRLRAAGTSCAVIALTGRASKGELAACKAAGCDDFLAKPVSLATLVSTAAAWRAIKG